MEEYRQKIKQYVRKGVKIGSDCRIWGTIDTKCPNIQIGNNVVLGEESRIVTHCPIRGMNDILIRIGNNVWIGFRCIILPNTIIKDRVLIGAGSVVSGTLESDSIYAGNPAKFIRKRDKREIIRTYLLLKQRKVISVKNIKPKWQISHDEIKEIFNISKDKEYTKEYSSLINDGGL